MKFKLYVFFSFILFSISLAHASNGPNELETDGFHFKALSSIELKELALKEALVEAEEEAQRNKGSTLHEMIDGNLQTIKVPADETAAPQFYQDRTRKEVEEIGDMPGLVYQVTKDQQSLGQLAFGSVLQLEEYTEYQPANDISVLPKFTPTDFLFRPIKCEPQNLEGIFGTFVTAYLTGNRVKHRLFISYVPHVIHEEFDNQDGAHVVRENDGDPEEYLAAIKKSGATFIGTFLEPANADEITVPELPPEASGFVDQTNITIESFSATYSDAVQLFMFAKK